MKKNDFKKLAMIGLAAGSMTMANTATAVPSVAADGILLAAKCGSKCGGGRAPGKGQIAMEDTKLPTNGNGNSCNGKSGCHTHPTNVDPNAQTNGNNSSSAIMNGQGQQHSCSAASNPNMGHSCSAASNPNMGHSCSSAAPNGYYMNNNAGCSAKSSNISSGCHARSGCQHTR